MKTEGLQCLRINCPEWYEREDFQNWLRTAYWKTALATWWRPGKEMGGEGASDYCDAFVVYDHGECGDWHAAEPDLPDDIYEEVCRLCDEAGMDYGVVWLSNVE